MASATTKDGLRTASWYEDGSQDAQDDYQEPTLSTTSLEKYFAKPEDSPADAQDGPQTLQN